MTASTSRIAATGAVGLLITAPLALHWNSAGRPTPEIYLSDLPLILLVGAFLGWILHTDRPLHTGPRAIWQPLLVLVAIGSLSIAWAPIPALAADGALRLLLSLALYFAFVNLDLPDEWAAGALLLGATIQGAIAFLQFIGQHPVGLAGLGEVWYPLPGSGWSRGLGLSPHPNILGGYLVVGLLAGVNFSAKDMARRLALSSALVIGVAGLVTTASRSAWLALLVGLVVILFHRRRQWRQIVVSWTFVPALVALLIMGLAFRDRLSARIVGPLAPMVGLEERQAALGEPDVIANRWETLRAAVVLATENPELGVGEGNFAAAWLIHRTPVPNDNVYLPVHNVPLLIAAELGIGGAIAWMAIWITVILTVQRRRQVTGQWELAWSSVLAALFVIGLLDYYPWGWQQGRLLFFVVLGLWTRAALTTSHCPQDVDRISSLVGATVSPIGSVISLGKKEVRDAC